MFGMDDWWDPVRAFAVGAGLLVLWLTTAVTVVRWPMRRAAGREKRWLHEVGVRYSWIIALTPVVFCLGWPGLGMVGVADAGAVASLGGVLTVAPVGVLWWWRGAVAVWWLATAPAMYALAALCLRG
jgi:hypothetical protein